jgi:hypothetical protein
LEAIGVDLDELSSHSCSGRRRTGLDREAPRPSGIRRIDPPAQILDVHGMFGLSVDDRIDHLARIDLCLGDRR